VSGPEGPRPHHTNARIGIRREGSEVLLVFRLSDPLAAEVLEEQLTHQVRQEHRIVVNLLRSVVPPRVE
jgi:hypothetical protein